MRIEALSEEHSTKHVARARSALSDVIDACREGERGYERGAREVRDPRLKDLLSDYAVQRGDFACALDKYLVALGGRPRRLLGESGWVRRKWLDVRSAIDQTSTIAVLSACERSENTARMRYQRALSIPLPVELRNLMLDELSEIRRVHDLLGRMSGR